MDSTTCTCLPLLFFTSLVLFYSPFPSSSPILTITISGPPALPTRTPQRYCRPSRLLADSIQWQKWRLKELVDNEDRMNACQKQNKTHKNPSREMIYAFYYLLWALGMKFRGWRDRGIIQPAPLNLQMRKPSLKVKWYGVLYYIGEQTKGLETKWLK